MCVWVHIHTLTSIMWMHCYEPVKARLLLPEIQKTSTRHKSRTATEKILMEKPQTLCPIRESNPGPLAQNLRLRPQRSSTHICICNFFVVFVSIECDFGLGRGRRKNRIPAAGTTWLSCHQRPKRSSLELRSPFLYHTVVQRHGSATEEYVAD